jgi:hypothetical protein
MRAKDSDRTGVCQALDTALAEGQLSMEEHRQRIARATSAATLGDLQGLLVDLQLSHPPALTRKPLPGWAIAAAVGAVVLVVGGLAAWGLSDRTTSRPDHTASAPAVKAPPSAAADGSPQAGPTTAPTSTGPRLLHSVSGVNGLLEQVRKKFGDAKGYELSVYTDYAEMVRDDTEDDRFIARWRYEAGEWTGPGTTPRTAADAHVVDLSAFNPEAVIAVIRGVPDTMGLKPMNVLRTWFTIEPAKDPTAPEALTVRINVSTSFGDGLIDLDAAGNVKQVKKPF